MFSGVVVAIFIARHFGPTNFGILNYVLAFTALFIPFSQLGMSLILVRELVENPKKKQQILSSAFYLILGFSCLAIFALNIFNFFFTDNELTRAFILCYSIGIIFKCLDVIDFNFQSQIKAKFSSKAKALAVLLSSILKLSIIFTNAPFSYLIYVFCLDFFITALFLIVFHLKENRRINFLLGFNIKQAKLLIKSSWPIVFSTLSIVLYMKIDQLMIKNLIGTRELGIYSSAVRLYDGFTSIIFTLTVSLLPIIIKFKSKSKEEYKAILIKMFTYIFWGCISVALGVTFFSSFIIKLLYGEEYIEAGNILAIVFWSIGFVAFGSLSSRYFIVEKMENKILIRTLVSVICNVSLNVVLIPEFGIIGAAIATLIALVVGNYGVDYFDKDLKMLLQIKNRALLFNYFKKP